MQSFRKCISYNEHVNDGWYKVYFALPSAVRRASAPIGKLWYVKVEQHIDEATTIRSVWICFVYVCGEGGQWLFGNAQVLTLHGIPFAGYAPSELVEMIRTNGSFLRYSTAETLCEEDQRVLSWGMAARACRAML